MPLATSSALAAINGGAASRVRDGGADVAVVKATRHSNNNNNNNNNNSGGAVQASKGGRSVFSRIHQASAGGDWMATPLSKSRVDGVKAAAAAKSTTTTTSAAAAAARPSALLLPPKPVELADVPTPPTTPQLASSSLGFLSRLCGVGSSSNSSSKATATSQLTRPLDATTTTSARQPLSPPRQASHAAHMASSKLAAHAAAATSSTRPTMTTTTTLLPVDAYLQLDTLAPRNSPSTATATTATTTTATTTAGSRSREAMVVVGKDIHMPLALGGDTWSALGSVTLPGTLAMRRRGNVHSNNSNNNNNNNKKQQQQHGHSGSADVGAATVTWASVPVAPASIDMVALTHKSSLLHSDATTTTAAVACHRGVAVAATVSPPHPLDDDALALVHDGATRTHDAPTLDAYSWRNNNNNSNNSSSNGHTTSTTLSATAVVAPPLPPAPLSTSPLRRHDSDTCGVATCALVDMDSNTMANTMTTTTTAPDVSWTRQHRATTAAATATTMTTHSHQHHVSPVGDVHDDAIDNNNVAPHMRDNTTTTMTSTATAAAASRNMNDGVTTATHAATLRPIGEDDDATAASATTATTATTATAATTATTAEPITAKRFLATLFAKDEHAATATGSHGNASPLYCSAMELATSRGRKATQPTDYSVFFNTTLFDDTDDDVGGKDDFSLDQLRSVLNSVLQSFGSDEATQTAATSTAFTSHHHHHHHNNSTSSSSSSGDVMYGSAFVGSGGSATTMAQVVDTATLPPSSSSSSSLGKAQSEWLRAPGSSIGSSSSSTSHHHHNGSSRALFHGF